MHAPCAFSQVHFPRLYLGRRELLVLSQMRASSPPPHMRQTWWTVDARAPEPDGVIDANQDRAISILLAILGLHLLDT